MDSSRLIAIVLAAAGLVCVFTFRTARTQSTTLRRVTNTSEEGINLNPSISGDGRVVGFESTEDVGNVGGSDHFRAIRGSVAADPAAFFQMAGTRAVAPAISQDGSRIAFASRDNPLGTNADGNSEIFLFDGVRLIQITNTKSGSIATRVTDGNFSPSISDDGRYIAFSSNRQLVGQNIDGNSEIYIYDVVAQGFAQLTNSASVVGSTEAKISGDGNSVAYIYDGGTTLSTSRRLLLQSRNGLTPVRVLAADVNGLALTYGRAISDDGARVVYAAETATNTTQVFLYDGRGDGAVRQITSLAARATEVPLHPSISGDGSRIAFATRRSVSGAGSNSDGGVELYVFDIPSSQMSKITDAPSPATADVVSSLNDDGSVVAFNFPRVLSGAVSNSDSANNSEIYLATTPSRPAFGVVTVLNGASFGHEPSTTKAIAPGSIAVARGSNLANTTQQSQRLPNGTFPISVAGAGVTVNGRAAQVFFVSPGQINFLVPPQTEIRAAEIVVTNSENFSTRGNISTLGAAPGIFTQSGDGTGAALVLNSDTLQDGPFDPTSGNLRLTVFATGARNAAQTLVIMGGRVLIPESVLPSDDLSGLDEVHIRVPNDLRGAGTVALSLISDGRESNPTTVNFVGDGSRDLVINEVLSDPPGSASTDLVGDANHDGVRSASDDEFVEIVNATSHDINIGGYQILTRASTTTTDTLRFTFAANTILPACTATVIFGGGTLDPNNPAFGGAQIFKSSGLSLSNSGGFVTLRDNAGSVIGIFEYGGTTGLSGSSNQSLTRSPDVTGGFTGHSAATNSGGNPFSPGMRVNGAPFSACPSISRVEVSPASASIDSGTTQQFTAKAFDAFNNEVNGVIFSWQSSNTSAATIDNTGLATGVAPGTTQITATGRGTGSSSATLVVNVAPIGSTPPVLISEVYGGGGNSGAPFKNDFIELFNRGATTVDMAGWSVQQASATGTSWSVTPICPSGSCLLAAGQYFLVKEAGGANGADLPAADATGTINLSSTDGKVALVRNTTALSGTDCANWKARAIDFVGYGGANCFEGSGAAPTPSNTKSDLRHNNGCTDTDNNVADFSTGDVAPRNTSSPLNTCGAASPTPTPTPSPSPSPMSASPIVISEFRTRGPGGASDEFVELYNNSDSAIDISGWKIKGSNDSGSVTTRVTISAGTTIPARGHFLATNSSSSAYSGSVAGNQTYTSGITDDGGVAITNASDVISDQVGMSSGSAFKEGNVLTPLTTNTNQSYERKPGGSFGSTQDTNDNASDFQSINPSDPQNLSSAPTSGGTPTPTPTPTPNLPSITINDVTVTEGDGGNSTATFAVSLNTSSAQTITVNFATANGTATAGSDYQSASGTLTFNSGETSRTILVTVNGDRLVEPDETFFVNLTNATGATIGDPQGVGTIQNDDVAQIIISQIYGGGNNTGATYKNDFVELFNRGTTTVDLAGWSVQQASATGTSWSVTLLCPSGSCLITPGRYFLVKEGPSSPTVGADLPAPDATGTSNLSVTSGKLALVSNSTALTSSGCPLGSSIADFVGYGTTADCSENSTRAPAHSNTSADFRRAGGCTDTNDNAADFFVNAPFPRNSSSPGNDCVTGVTPNISINDVTVTEGNNATTTTATFTVSLSQPAQGHDVTFDIATADGTATTANNDYTAKSLTAQIIPSGQTTYTFTVAINGDLSVEPDETFSVNVTNVAGANVADAQASGTIQNDDLPTLSIDDVSANEGNGGATTFSFHVTLSAPAPSTVTFDIATADGTATVADNDYVPRTLSKQTIAQGSSSYTFEVTVNGDVNIEPSETFFVTVANVSGANILDGQGAGTIQDDDSPVLSIDSVSHAEANSGPTTFTFTVTSTLAAPAGGISFDIATADHTATSASGDYVARNVIGATIPQGSTTYTFDVTVNSDTSPEPDETFFVNISNPSPGASISSGQGTGTIQNDDGALMVISQVYGGGGNSGSIYKNDFIEIFNRSIVAVDVTGWSVQYASATSTGTWSLTPLCPTGPCIITPGQYFLVQEDQGAGGTTNLPTPDASGTISMTAGAGKVALVSNATALSGQCPAGVLDEVGYGSTANCFEGSGPTSAPANATAAFRKSGGCVDTNDNAVDFSISAAMPRNSASAANDCSAPDIAITDVAITEGDSGTVNANFTVSLSGASTQTITVNYATADGTAKAPSDYQSASGTLTFNPGDTQQTITVLVNGDTTNEAICETFFVNLTNAVNASVSDAQGQGSITDDDGTKLVISQIYGGGGNSSATYTNDFIELFNRGNAALNLNGLSAQYAPATGTSGSYSVTALPSVTLQPGHYYLIQEASGGANGNALPSPDVTNGTIDLSASAGRVALVNGTTALSRTSCPTGATILDFVGYGSSAICREGASTSDNAPGASNNTTSVQRQQSGCQDLNLNGPSGTGDFSSGSANPRNTSSPTNTCSCTTSYSSMFTLDKDSWSGSLAFLNLTH